MTLKKRDFLLEVYGNFEINIFLTRSVWKFRNQDFSTQVPFGQTNVQNITKTMNISKTNMKNVNEHVNVRMLWTGEDTYFLVLRGSISTLSWG